MGKRSTFERRERDFYRTPIDAVVPLLPHLGGPRRFVEPCAGDGALVRFLTLCGHVCVWAGDVEPQAPGICVADAQTVALPPADLAITNPPWARKLLHPTTVNLSDQMPTWLLFDADWAHTKQARPYLSRLRRIVSVGRVQWIEGTGMTGKDNCAWHLFTTPSDEPTRFYGR